APVVDALPVPWLSERLGRRRGWLVASQLGLMAAIGFLGTRDPGAAPLAWGPGARLCAFASPPQDLVTHASRAEQLRVGEPAARRQGGRRRRHGGVGRGRHGAGLLARGAGVGQGYGVADRLWRCGAAGACRASRRTNGPRARLRHARKPDRAHTCTLAADGTRGILGFPVA